MLKRTLSLLNFLLPLLLVFSILSKNYIIIALFITALGFLILLVIITQRDKIGLLIAASFILMIFMDLRYEMLPHFYVGLADLVFLAFVGLSIFIFFKSKKEKLPKPIILFFVFMMFFSIYGFWFSKNILLNLRYLITMGYIFSFIYIYWQYIDSNKKYFKFIKIIAFMTLYPITISLLELIFKHDINAIHQLTYSFAERGIRVSGNLAGPNAFAYYLSFTIPYIMIALNNSKKKKILIALLILNCLAILLTSSRSGFIFIFIFITGYLFYYQKIKVGGFSLKKMLIVSGITMFFIFIGYMLLEARFKGDYTVGNDLSLISRYFVWDSALRLFSSHPFLGIGFGNFTFEYEKFFHINEKMFLDISNLYHAHNFVFHSLAEIGLIGFSVVASFIAYLFFTIFPLTKSNNMKKKQIGGIFLFSIIGIFASQFFDFVIADPKHFLYIFITAIYFISIFKYQKLNMDLND